MNYHVFVVDDKTFKVHLEYLFAGTGYRDKTVPFLSQAPNAHLHHSIERVLVGMLADISRLRVGDKVIFYLQANKTESITKHDGLFFGIFRVASNPFFDENNGNNYLRAELGKGLIFRCLIAPDELYAYGVTEHDYLDSLCGISHPSQMCWSMIYRKLKGNRGCTMITKFEFDMLLSKLRRANNVRLDNVQGLTFNKENVCIEQIEQRHLYEREQRSIDIKRRMLIKANNNKAFEVHLQAYILQNFDTNDLRDLILHCLNLPCWIGNEVSCGVGMQRIDIMVKQEDEDNVFIKIIELKCVPPEKYILEDQLPWYLDWVFDYIVPTYRNSGKVIRVIPCVLAKQTDDNTFLERARSFRYQFPQNNNDNVVVEPLQYISFTTSDSDINFVREL